MVIFGQFSAEIAYFCDYEPLNVVFGANFIPYPKGLNTRDFLSQFWFVKISIPCTWGLRKGFKMAIFWRFSAGIAYFCDYEPLNMVFGANFIPYPKNLNTRDFLSQFWFVQISIPWTWGHWKGSKMVILGNFKLKSHTFAFMSPSKWFLVLISYPTPKAWLLETLYANFGLLKFRTHGFGNSERGPKWSFLSHFQLKSHTFEILSPSMLFLVLISFPTPKA